MMFKKSIAAYCKNHAKHRYRMQSFNMLKLVVHTVTTGIWKGYCAPNGTKFRCNSLSLCEARSNHGGVLGSRGTILHIFLPVPVGEAVRQFHSREVAVLSG
jgi:hypothetical protein